MDKQKAMGIAYWIMIMIVIATCITLISYLIGNAKQCLADPLSFYQNITKASCYCINP